MANQTVNSQPNLTNDGAVVAICVATFRRPVFLRDLIESIRDVELNGFRAHLIIADNDSAASGGEAVKRQTSDFPIPVTYVVESERGLASVRNRLVREAAGIGADYVAFVDDDQVVEPSWLKHLVKTAITYDKDAVLGRWVPRFEPGVADWAKKCECFQGPAIQITGTPVRYFTTNNALITLRALRLVPGPFDTSRNLSGGEGNLLMHQLHQLGIEDVHCAESVVYERISPSRATAIWAVKRQFRAAVGAAIMVRNHDGSFKAIVNRSLRSLGLVGRSLVKMILAIPGGKPALVMQASELARGIGGLVGIAYGRHVYYEYRKTHGS